MATVKEECRALALPPRSPAEGSADKHRRLGRPVHLVGVKLSREDCNIAAFEVARAA